MIIVRKVLALNMILCFNYETKARVIDDLRLLVTQNTLALFIAKGKNTNGCNGLAFPFTTN